MTAIPIDASVEIAIVNEALRGARSDEVRARYVSISPDAHSQGEQIYRYAHRGPGHLDPAHILRSARLLWTAETPVPRADLGAMIVEAISPNPMDQLHEMYGVVGSLHVQLQQLQSRLASMGETALVEREIDTEWESSVADIVVDGVSEVCRDVRIVGSTWSSDGAGCRVLTLRVRMRAGADPDEDLAVIECAHRAFVQATTSAERLYAELDVRILEGR